MTDYVEIWQRAQTTGDATIAGDALAPDAELVSPLTAAFTFQGRDEIVELMHSVFESFLGIESTARLDTPGQSVLLLEGTVRGETMQECQVLELDDEGRIRRATLYLRPLPVAAHLLRELGRRVPRRQGRPFASVVLRGAGFLLDSVASTGERVFLPISAPRR